MDLLENINLKAFHTFGIDVNARYFHEVSDELELVDILKTLKPEHWPLLVLGSGSNMLFTSDWHGTVLKISMKGIEITAENEDDVFVRAAAGEIWDDFIEYTVDNGWGGLENLSVIPGNVGASPIQNIGAYGVELKDVFQELEVIEIGSKTKRKFTKEDCCFAYRESVFKGALKGRYIITHVTLCLSKMPVIRTEYGTIREELKSMGITDPGIKDVRVAVSRIRTRKLPDPLLIGNAGSFFKNPVIPESDYMGNEEKFSNIMVWPQSNGYKLAAAGLIERCGWKGKRFGDAGVCETQPVVLVNYGHATGQEIVDLAEKIMASVKEKFDIQLQTEVNII